MPPYSWNTDKVGINYQSINKIKTKKDIMFMFDVFLYCSFTSVVIMVSMMASSEVNL